MREFCSVVSLKAKNAVIGVFHLLPEFLEAVQHLGLVVHAVHARNPGIVVNKVHKVLAVVDQGLFLCFALDVHVHKLQLARCTWGLQLDHRLLLVLAFDASFTQRLGNWQGIFVVALG